MSAVISFANYLGLKILNRIFTPAATYFVKLPRPKKPFGFFTVGVRVGVRD
jgi:hypothetical protein